MVSLEGQEELFGRGFTIVYVAAVPRVDAVVGVLVLRAAPGLLDEEHERRAAARRLGVSVPKLKSLEVLGKGLEALFVDGALLGGVLKEVGVNLEDELSIDVLPLLMSFVAHAAGAHPRAARPHEDDTGSTL